MSRIFSILLILTGFMATSQNAIINGIAEASKGSMVRIIAYDDLFSDREVTLAKSTISSDGSFKMELQVDSTIFVYLAVDLERGEFYLSPGSSYFFEVVKDSALPNASIFDRLPLKFALTSNDNGIQDQLGNFNLKYNEFIYNNVRSIYSGRDKKVVKNFIYEIYSESVDIKSDYVSNYIEYTLASLKWLSKIENNREILDKYFINRPVLYNNIQYCDFFKEFFKSYFNSEKLFRYEDLIPSLNSNRGIIDLNELIARDSILVADKQVSEIVSMLLMSRYYFDRYVDKNEIISKFSFIAQFSDFSENRKIATNFIQELKHLETGSTAPYFELVDNDNKTVSITDFNNRFVLLSFVNNDCRMCEFHMQELQKMREKLDFEIITIVSDNESKELKQYAETRNFNWPILNVGNDILLLEEYNVKVYPTYILINPDGTIAYVHLPMPTENMELYLSRFMEKYKNTNN